MAQGSSKFCSPTTFTRRPGSDDVGKDYEIKITALLALRAITQPDIKDVWLGSNVNEAGDFDDVVLFVENQQGNSKANLMQMKHQYNPRDIKPEHFMQQKSKEMTKERKNLPKDFSLEKYLKSYLNIKNALKKSVEGDIGILKSLQSVDEIILVLYTNRGVSKKCDFWSQVDYKSFLNTCENETGIFKLKDSLDYDSDFVKKLLLFANQAHVSDVNDLINKEFQKMITSCSSFDIDALTLKFLEFIKTWMRGTGKTDGSKNEVLQILTKKDLLGQITRILEPFCLTLTTDLFKNLEFSWKDILEDKCVTVVNKSENVNNFLVDNASSEPTCSNSRANNRNEKDANWKASGFAGNSNDTYVMWQLATIRQQLNELTEEVRQFKEINTRQGNLGNNLNQDIEEQLTLNLFDFPIETSEELNKLEEFLSIELHFKKFVHELSRIGGDNMNDCTKRILNNILDSKLAQDYSWIGCKKKNNFSKLYLSKAVIAAVQASKQNVETSIIKWLVDAKQRVLAIQKKNVQDPAVDDDHIHSIPDYFNFKYLCIICIILVLVINSYN